LAKKLAAAYPNADCALRHRSAHELLVATILSAQCTDRRVNQVTPALFARYPTVEAFASARTAELQKAIHSTGFFRNKARSIMGACQRIRDAYGGEVPNLMEELVTLPGVARKTANVILGTWFGRAGGVVVDTHVFRIAYRLGLTSNRNPVQTERELMDLLPKREWTPFAHRVILHGRAVCTARAPDCGACSLERSCHKNGVAPPKPKPKPQRKLPQRKVLVRRG